LVVSDSKYVIDAVKKGWLFQWEKKNFKGKKNPDLWKRFLKIHAQHKVSFRWIKGHSGHTQNEKCDELAVMASEEPNLLVDHGYENLSDNNQIFK
jgi:ribonuclease HI